jgi:hypothetical protein
VAYIVTVSGAPSPSTSAVVWLARKEPGAGAVAHVAGVFAGAEVEVGLVAAVVDGNPPDARSVDAAGPTVGLGSLSLEQAPSNVTRQTAATRAVRRRFIARSGWPDPT